MSIARMCELARALVIEGEDEDRQACTRHSATLLALTRTLESEMHVYVERLRLEGARVRKTPPTRGES